MAPWLPRTASRACLCIPRGWYGGQARGSPPGTGTPCLQQPPYGAIHTLCQQRQGQRPVGCTNSSCPASPALLPPTLSTQPAQLSLRRAEPSMLKVSVSLNPCLPTAAPAKRRSLQQLRLSCGPQHSLGSLHTSLTPEKSPPNCWAPQGVSKAPLYLQGCPLWTVTRCRRWTDASSTALTAPTTLKNMWIPHKPQAHVALERV